MLFQVGEYAHSGGVAESVNMCRFLCCSETIDKERGEKKKRNMGLLKCTDVIREQSQTLSLVR